MSYICFYTMNNKPNIHSWIKEIKALNRYSYEFLGLVRFFQQGRKYLYYREDIEKVSNMLRRKEIEIKTDKGYYITKN